jgi:hypothetical protein
VIRIGEQRLTDATRLERVRLVIEGRAMPKGP